MSTRALLELPRSEVFKWSAVYLASRQGLKRDIFGGEVFANTDIFFRDRRGVMFCFTRRKSCNKNFWN